jgi:hypothetical protein
MLRALAATATRIGVDTTAGPLIQRFGARTVTSGMWALAMLAVPLGAEVGFDEAAETFIVLRIESLAAKYRGQR